MNVVDISELLNVLPHRYPILLVDRILEINEEGTKCKGLKNVTINEPFFQGHYPGNPIMPGVLIIESMAQVGAALLMKNPKLAGRIPLIGAIEEVKFRRMVRPGDQLIHDIDILWVKGNVGKMNAVATVDGEVAASMTMLFKLSEKPG
jgi:3-hydroxyacyl-[acyl-carrier-protein] dehydratase